MRIIYFLLKLFLQYSIRIYYPRLNFVNSPKRFFGRTIYVSNHASSFMDPLIIGVLQRPIVFFMVRSDVFNKFTIPFFNSAQMIPIYREQDGEKNNSKNEHVFKKCSNVLKSGRNLLIFGEGFTDDTFVRRLKPLKKGAARIGFITLENLNWQKKIYVATIGLNYSNPSILGSDLLISNSNRICLNDYQNKYLENPAKVINEITKILEEDLKNQITHVNNLNWVFFHEHISRLKRNGLDPYDTDFSISLKKRWQNSKDLASWINKQNLDENEHLLELKIELEKYFDLLKKKEIKEKHIFELSKNKSLNINNLLIKLFLLIPFALIGLIHFYIPYFIVKSFSEKVMKRPVFWSSVKMFLGAILISLWNIPIFYYLNKFWIHNSWISFGVYLILPLFGVLAYKFMLTFRELKEKMKLKKLELSELVNKRKELLIKISERIDSNFN